MSKPTTPEVGSAFTPGPWRVDAAGDGRIVSEHFCVARVTRGVDEHCNQELIGPTYEANAHLIAAAPDLLHALEMVRDADDDCHRDSLPTIPVSARACIDCAIAKAEGR